MHGPISIISDASRGFPDKESFIPEPPILNVSLRYLDPYIDPYCDETKGHLRYKRADKPNRIPSTSQNHRTLIFKTLEFEINNSSQKKDSNTDRIVAPNIELLTETKPVLRFAGPATVYAYTDRLGGNKTAPGFGGRQPRR